MAGSPIGANVTTIGSSFDDTDLTANVLSISHNLNSSNVELTVYDGDGYLQDINGLMQIVSANEVQVDFGGAIVGTWSYIFKKYIG